MNMSRHQFIAAITILSVALVTAKQAQATDTSDAIGLFEAMDGGEADVTFIAKNDREARLLITNKTNLPLNLNLPAAFAGVPALAQFGGGAAGGGGFGGGGRTGGGGGQQAVGGGMGGGGGGLGGGGGIFSIPPEKTAKINLAVVCLDHGLRNPSSSKPYKIVPASAHVDRPAVVELLQAFGRGELDHGAAQAAAWHLNNDLSWQELAAKREGTRRTPSRQPYFTPQQIQAGMAYAAEASRLAEVNREAHEREHTAQLKKLNAPIDSHSRSTSEQAPLEPEATEAQHEEIDDDA
jgi:hypothetical protein